MSPVGFDLTISTGKRPLTYTLDCEATATGMYYIYRVFQEE
jgi:hypothetical protein